jgi:hypothetical protein
MEQVDKTGEKATLSKNGGCRIATTVGFLTARNKAGRTQCEAEQDGIVLT